MRTLYVKLILVFLAVSLAGTFLAAFLIGKRNEKAFNRLLREQGEAYFVRDVQAYYVATGSFRGIEPMLRVRYVPRGPNGSPAALPFAVADVNGQVVVPAGPWQRGEVVPREVLSDGLPVTMEGREIGTVLLQEWAPARQPSEERYLNDVSQALALGAVGATGIALILGAVLAHELTRPLREIAAASHAVAQGDLGHQVPVRTRDELGDLAVAFNRMSAALARATEQRRQMTADIAHDLRTPLTVLAGYLEAMEEGTLTPTPERLAIMRQEVSGLNRLVEDLRTLSLADAGELPLDLQEVEVEQLLTQVRDAYRPQAERQEVELHVEVGSDLPTARLDRERMRQVLGNLVNNALRHSAGGRVVLEATTDGLSGLLLRVRDSGVGIPVEDLPHIFERFYRGDRARSNSEGASGLGLAIARSLVEMHGGTIRAESEPGQGTTFVIHLPL